MHAIKTDEAGRLKALESYRILYTEREAAFDALTETIQTTIGTELASVTLVDEHHQWFKSICGADMRGSSRDVAFCDHAIRAPGMLEVNDARTDSRFADNPFVTNEPHIRSYLGKPLRTPEGYQIGSVCAIGMQPRIFSDADRAIVANIGTVVMEMLAMRREIEANRPISAVIDKHRWEALLTADLRHAALPPVIAMIEVDDHAELCALYGQKMADRVLSAVMDFVSRHAPNGSKISRVTTTAFAVAMPDIPARQALSMMDWIRDAIGDMVIDLTPEDAASTTVTIGVVRSGVGEGLASLMARSDAILRRARSQGTDSLASAIDDSSPLDWAAAQA